MDVYSPSMRLARLSRCSMNDHFEIAVRILLTVACNQNEGRLTSVGELAKWNSGRAFETISTISKLVDTKLLVANGPAYRLARSSSKILLREIYSATLTAPPRGGKPFDAMYGSLVEEACHEVTNELGDASVGGTLESLMTTYLPRRVSRDR